MLWLAQIPKSQPQPLTPGSEKHKGGLPQGLGHPFLGSFTCPPFTSIFSPEDNTKREAEHWRAHPGLGVGQSGRGSGGRSLVAGRGVQVYISNLPQAPGTASSCLEPGSTSFQEGIRPSCLGPQSTDISVAPGESDGNTTC